MLNGLLDDVCQNVDEQSGLESFTLSDFGEKNPLESWVLNRLAMKSHNLQRIVI